jgi:hypothetical protein
MVEIADDEFLNELDRRLRAGGGEVRGIEYRGPSCCTETIVIPWG